MIATWNGGRFIVDRSSPRRLEPGGAAVHGVRSAAIAQRFVASQVGQQVEDAGEVLEATEEQVLAEIRDIGSRLQVLEASVQRLARRGS